MRVVCCYTDRLLAETRAALPSSAELFDVSADSHAYWRVIRDVWADGESFVVIEHDVVIHDDVMRQFGECPHPWCGFPYDNICHWGCMNAWANQFGCARFSSELIGACPAAVSSIPEDMRGWHNLCDHIAGNKTHGVDTPLRPGSVRAAGFSHHWHFPPVEHHHGDRGIPVDWEKVMGDHAAAASQS